MISEVYIENYRVYKDNFVLIVFFLFDEWILYVLRGVNCVFVNNVWNGKQVLLLKCNDYFLVVISLGIF